MADTKATGYVPERLPKLHPLRKLAWRIDDFLDDAESRYLSEYLDAAYDGAVKDANELTRLSAEVARLKEGLEVARRDGERTFDAGWKMAAAWACRDDLLADMDSNTFKADKLAAIDAAREG